MSDWKPIDTAPKDDRLLVWVPGLEEAISAIYHSQPIGWIADIHKDAYGCDFEGEFIRLCPTHWMPLPNPPIDMEDAAWGI